MSLEKPVPHGVDAAAPCGSELCTACGLCCTGLLFDVAPLEAREIPLAERLRLPLASNQYHEAFRLPCPCQQDKRCTVYDMRPSVCGSYACGLLRRLQAGDVSLAEALGRVERVLRLVADLRQRVPAGSPPRPLWDEVRDHLARRTAEEADSLAWREEREVVESARAALRRACREGLDP